jgi:glycosyltransferase involved in cell wall biosynthesis
MTHLLISREYPPCTYPMGGIGTYVRHIARLLAERGETVHVIAERWQGAPRAREVLCEGRLVIHRVWTARPLDGSLTPHEDADVLEAMAASPFPAQAFGWQAAQLAERLIEREQIDIIEAQDYEAPLYYFLARRARGLGPSLRPPCFVHLHTTYEQVCVANGWSVDTPHARLVRDHEDGAIRGADALLAPSRFLAQQVETQFALVPGSIATIPYPIGDVPMLERTSDTWKAGTICFVGRYEVRKGLFEWVPAAIQAASKWPGLRFEFIGADTAIAGDGASTSVRATLESSVPTSVRQAFAFRDAVPQSQLWDRLRGARLAVVPSRWENFPNTCVEAMCSGLPVLATPNGGMVEMIEDGVTGWIAASNSADDLARALERALILPAQDLAAMGRRASRAIRAMCDNARTVERQLEFRRGLVKVGASHSCRLPPDADRKLSAIRPHAAGTIGTGRPLSPPSSAVSRGTWVQARSALANPAYTARWLLWRLRRLARRRAR